MDNDKIKDNKLRKKAEKVLQSQFDRINEQSKSLDEVINELRVHQIELEMQNEELRKAQLELEDSRRQYFELYDLAPVGYLTVDKNGLIIKINLTGADIFRVPRGNLINNAFIRFIAPNFKRAYYKHTKKVLENQTKQQCELKLISNNEIPLFCLFKYDCCK